MGRVGATLRSDAPDEASAEIRSYKRAHRSLLRYSPALLILVICIADAAQVTDPDLWGHIRFGQAALAEHNLGAALLGKGLAKRDPYSYSAAHSEWCDPEWLSEILMALVYTHGGVIGLKGWKFACVGATLGFLMLGLMEAGATPAVQLGLLIVAAVAMMPQMQFRPQLSTFVMLAATLAILAQDNYRRAAPLWLVPPMMILWTNLHGGFVVGIVAIAAYGGVAGCTDLIAGRGRTRGVRFALLTFAAILATLFNPYGFGEWSAVMHSVANQSTRTAIVEWQPLWRGMASQWHDSAVGEFNYLLVLGLVAALVLNFAMRPRRGDLPMLAVAILMSVGACISARNMPLAVIACVVPLAGRVSLATAEAGAEKEDAASGAVPQRSGVNQWVVIAITVFLAIYTGIFSPRLSIGMPVPASAVAFMGQHRLYGNVLNDYDWGAYLIWHIAPRSKLFIDGRCETVFSDKILNEYISFYFDCAGAGKVLRTYPHDFVLIPPRAPAYQLLKEDANWKLVYRDETAVLFARSNSAAAKIPGVPIDGGVPKRRYFPG